MLRQLSILSTFLLALGGSSIAQTPQLPPMPGITPTTGGHAGGAFLQGANCVWQPITVSFNGPAHGELDDAPNPFLDYRMAVLLLSPSGALYVVPGFFDGDGQGGSNGNQWTFRFTPDEAGTWAWYVSFRQGTDLAVDTNYLNGTPLSFNGSVGSVVVDAADPTADGFYRLGALEYAGEHYRKFRGGGYFLKTGVGGPENFFGYRGFDNTIDQPGGANTSGLNMGLHEYGPHVADWNAGDPLFTSDVGVDSRGIIGALNYLSSRGLNSFYFIANNIGGDGGDTYPWVGPGQDDFDLQHFDLSKLHQWEQVLDHAMRKGILVHFGLGEGQAANTALLDNGTLGTNRKLFYREMIARFGHLLALEWDLCQDNTYSIVELDAFSSYIASLDAYNHPQTFQTPLLDSTGDYADYTTALGNPAVDVASLFHDRADSGAVIERWRDDSAASGRKWIVDSVQQWPQNDGLSEDNADLVREELLWDALFSGGNVEFYLGRHNLPEGGNMRLEDFRTRDEMWDYVGHANALMSLMPYWDMEPADELLTGESSTKGGAEVFRLPGQLYAIYYPDTSVQGSLDLTETNGGTFAAVWYDPRSGSFAGTPLVFTGGSVVPVPQPPDATGGSVFQEQNGLLVMQAETIPVVPQWTLDTAVAGFTGNGYIRWDGPNMFGTPGAGLTVFNFEIQNAGTYNLSIHNYHDAPEPDQNNDCWIKMDGDNSKKVFSNNGTSTVGVWNWASDFESTGDQAQYFLDAGPHTMKLSGRSNGFHIDRFHLWLSSANDPLNLNNPESPRTGGGSPEDWVLIAVRIG